MKAKILFMDGRQHERRRPLIETLGASATVVILPTAPVERPAPKKPQDLAAAMKAAGAKLKVRKPRKVKPDALLEG